MLELVEFIRIENNALSIKQLSLLSIKYLYLTGPFERSAVRCWSSWNSSAWRTISPSSSTWSRSSVTGWLQWITWTPSRRFASNMIRWAASDATDQEYVIPYIPYIPYISYIYGRPQAPSQLHNLISSSLTTSVWLPHWLKVAVGQKQFVCDTAKTPTSMPPCLLLLDASLSERALVGESAEGYPPCSETFIIVLCKLIELS